MDYPNNTDKGKCSRCGQCCHTLNLPMTHTEYVNCYHIYKSLDPSVSMSNIHCPFYDEGCLIYDDRPTICKVFLCNMVGDEVQKALASSLNHSPMVGDYLNIYNMNGFFID